MIFIFDLDFRIGIVAGIALHIGMLLYVQNTPKMDMVVTNGHYVLTLQHGIAFPVCEVGQLKMAQFSKLYFKPVFRRFWMKLMIM